MFLYSKIEDMKKILLSTVVMGTFILYGFHQRSEASAARSVITTSSPVPPSFVPTHMMMTQRYKDGTFQGSVADAFYGNMQVEVVIQNGSISDIHILQSPNDRDTSVEINAQALPILKQEAIQVQSAQVDSVSGATDSSSAFKQSLQSALSQAT